MIDQYLSHGWSLIPIKHRDKRPVGEWLPAQSQRAHPMQVHAWMEEELNIGVVTGSLSGVVVVDCDSQDAVHDVARRGIPITPTATTGAGKHYFLRAPEEPIRNAVRVGQSEIDLRGEGGYVVIPPSVHPSGKEYRWVTGLSLADVPLAPCPQWVIDAGRVASRDAPRHEPDEWSRIFSERVPNGQRNQRCAELAGFLLRKYVPVGAVEELMLGWNDRQCHPPMGSAEVKRTVASINAREERRRG